MTNKLTYGRRRENGMTLIGWVVTIAAAAVFVVGGLRLVPVYLEHMKIVSVLDGLEQEFASGGASPQSLRFALSKRLDIDNVQVLKVGDFKIKPRGPSYEVTAKYENKVPFLGNVYFSVDFEKTVEVSR